MPFQTPVIFLFNDIPNSNRICDLHIDYSINTRNNFPFTPNTCKINFDNNTRFYFIIQAVHVDKQINMPPVANVYYEDEDEDEDK